MEGHHRQHQHHIHPHPQYQQQQLHIGANMDTGDRFPQWSIQETKEFLIIRAELDQTFLETKRNKALWEIVSSKMKEKGFNRSPDQCKCKWKNLVTRYKGCETMEPDTMRQQFPFYNELQEIFAARMQRMLWAEAEGSTSGLKKKVIVASGMSSDDDEDSDEEKASASKKKLKKAKNIASTSGGGSSSGVKELLEDFMKQQMQLEVQWRETFEARENERRMKELEWRQKMEALENERLMMERAWREREDQRRIREEARAERRDALVTALLNKLRREDNM